MYIEYSKNNRHYKFIFEYPLNLIIGDSATGKTDFIQQVIKNRKMVSTDASKIYINPIGIDFTTVVPNAIVLIDSDDVLLEDIKQISSMKRSDITFVIIGRKYAHNFPFAVMNTFHIVKENGIKVNKILYNPNEYIINNFSKVIVEDSKSGYLFFKSIFHDVSTSNGNGNIMKYITPNNLLILDSVGFGGYIEEFSKKVKNIDISYILYNSFESFILEEKFGYNDIPVCIYI